MRATTTQGIELLDLSSRLRKIGEWSTFVVNGWSIPDVARVALGMPNAHPGEETVAELQALRSRLLELAELEPPAGIGWVADPWVQAVEASRLCGEINDVVLERRSDAAAVFRQMAEDCRRCGMTAEASKAEQRAAALEDSSSGDLDAQIAAAHAKTEHLPRGTFESVLCGIELGELLLQAGDTYRARAALLQAEDDLKIAGYVEPPDGMAVLTDMMSGTVGVPEPVAVRRMGEVLKLRLAFHRLYDGLARAFILDNPAKAADYRKMIESYRLLTPRSFGS
jgi:hypothetical protein